ncbi:cation/H(+) antiporter 18 [Amborella trichopoda]|uniref:cation/H(+) antiporter 18 n=1 Tax=Amborella trichopoda TaxID=13333 RepID=UPI0009BD9D52|nr:cation/H(+) antiporter 18 [Amborella trichopoda]|eukprot:XP_020532085.1 cation/H(+) antiporter 18 [Amborella trichopoda]
MANDAKLIMVMTMVILWAAVEEVVGYHSLIASFILGMVIPRDKGVASALLDKLYYPVGLVALPLYVTFSGYLVKAQHTPAQATDIAAWMPVLAIWGISILSMAVKVASALAVAWAYRSPLYEALLQGFLLNSRGFPDLMLINIGTEKQMLNFGCLIVVMLSSILSAFLVAPTVLDVMWATNKLELTYKHPGIENQGPVAELRLLACLHDIIDVPSTISLIETCCGSSDSPLSIYSMHLIEYNEQTATQLLYRHDASDAAISFFSNMHEEVCRSAEDMQTSIILLPFHKLQRVDGRMQERNSRFRKLNQKVIRHAPCPVGVLVDRGLGDTMLRSASRISQNRNVYGLFFGGPNDREAVALGCRLAEHPHRDCPELGPEGDLLASSEFSITSSVLVVIKGAPG